MQAFILIVSSISLRDLYRPAISKSQSGSVQIFEGDSFEV